ncbi:MAG: hypothetical protein KF862_14300 [Chitinophagaceae bacterium]|nr:hypothetical protein [Chitinophagaceae bacterium]
MKLLLTGFCLGIVVFAGRTQTIDESIAFKFRNPPLPYHMNLNVHHAPYEPAKQDMLLDSLLRCGYGGVATNVNWTEDYLKNSEAFSSFFRFARSARNKGMEVWLYDEKGYPSGMAGGHILSEHPEWESEGMFFKDTVITGPTKTGIPVLPGKLIIATAFPLKNGEVQFEKGEDLRHRLTGGRLQWNAPGGTWKIVQISSGALYHGFQAGTNRAGEVLRYPSLLLPEVTDRFIELTHKKYEEVSGSLLGDLFFSTFTDEPSSMAMPYHNLGYGVYPWKSNVSDAFKKRYGYNLQDRLISLMLDSGREGKKLRVQYFSIIADLMSSNYFKKIKDHCRTQTLKTGGHLLLEESMMACVPLYGNIMSCFRQMDIPGIDVLTVMPDFTRRYMISGRIAASAAELEGNSMVMSEICPVPDYAIHSGKEAPTLHAKGVVNRQLVAGVTKFNNYMQLQHENDAGKKAFNTYVARVSMLMSAGVRASRIAVYYPVETMWSKYRPFPSSLRGWDDVQGGDSDAQQLDQLFIGVSNLLYENQWEYSYIDNQGICESVVEDGKLRHGQSSWDVLILPGVETISEEAMQTISTFCKKGGKVIAIHAVPENSLSAFPSSIVKKYTADLLSAKTKSHQNFFFKKRFEPYGLNDLLSRLLEKEIVIFPKENVFCSQKIAAGKNAYLITNDNSHPKELDVTIKKGKSFMCWNPQTGETYPFIKDKKLRLGAFESIIIKED